MQYKLPLALSMARCNWPSLVSQFPGSTRCFTSIVPSSWEKPAVSCSRVKWPRWIITWITLSMLPRAKMPCSLFSTCPYRGHTLSILEVNAYAGPVIEEAVNQLVLITPLVQAQGLQMRQDISQLVYRRLQPFLSSYGMTLDTVKVQGLRPRNEHVKALISLKAFGLSESDAVRY